MGYSSHCRYPGGIKAKGGMGCLATEHPAARGGQIKMYPFSPSAAHLYQAPAAYCFYLKHFLMPVTCACTCSTSSASGVRSRDSGMRRYSTWKPSTDTKRETSCREGLAKWG